MNGTSVPAHRTVTVTQALKAALGLRVTGVSCVSRSAHAECGCGAFWSPDYHVRISGSSLLGVSSAVGIFCIISSALDTQTQNAIHYVPMI